MTVPRFFPPPLLEPSGHGFLLTFMHLSNNSPPQPRKLVPGALLKPRPLLVEKESEASGVPQRRGRRAGRAAQPAELADH